jgi:hypothetical protein
MDRYESLLEHLKMTQRHGLDAVANRLNDFVTRLDDLVETMQAAVQDALPVDPDELFPIAELESGLAELSATAREAPRGSAGVSLDNLRLLGGARSQSELLRALLPLLGDQVGRAVVLVIRDGVVTAWSGFGFDNPELIRSWSGGVAASPSFAALVETGRPLMVDPQADPLISGWLQRHGTPAEGALLPISLRGKLMGIVYVDHDGDQPWNLESARALLVTACLLIDTLHHRSDAPPAMLAEIAPPLSAPTDASLQEVFETEAEFEPEPMTDGFGREEAMDFEPVTETPPPDASWNQVAGIAEETLVADDAGVGGEVESDYDFEPEPAANETSPAEAGFDPSATMRVEVADEEAPTDFEPPSQPDYPPPSLVSEVRPSEPTPAEQHEAPPPVRPLEPPVVAVPVSQARSASPEADARQEEARRFARLLVSEIKLYNEEEVDRGRAEKDLAKRLREDIERSREMFEKRIPAHIRSGRDYFQEELVRILADGNPDVLGS